MKHCVIRLLLTYLAFLVGACNSISLLPDRSIPVVTVTFLSQTILPESVGRFVELRRLTVSQAGPVAQLAYSQDLQTLLVVYAKEGVLRHWGVADGSLIKTLNVYPVGLGGAAFSVDRSTLVASAGAEWEAHIIEDDYLGWQAWNVNTGDIVRRGGKYSDSLITRTFVPSIVLNNDGTWALMIAASAHDELRSYKRLSIDGVKANQTGAGFVDFSREAEEDDFDVIALDLQSEFFASADEAGKVAVYAFIPPDYPETPKAVIEEPKDRLGPRPLALGFDPRRQWLARACYGLIVDEPLRQQSA